MYDQRLPEIIRRKPRVINLLNQLRLIEPLTQVHREEMLTLIKYAQGKLNAVEVGTFMGMSALNIASVMGDNGKLYCIDPWSKSDDDPCLKIFKREIKRRNLEDKIVIIQKYSDEAEDDFPVETDFVFIDAIHTYEALEKDWAIANKKLARGGIACFHDCATQGKLSGVGSGRYFEQVILNDKNYEHLETVRTLQVLRKIEG